jgi:hypothetical protein
MGIEWGLEGNSRALEYPGITRNNPEYPGERRAGVPISTPDSQAKYPFARLRESPIPVRVISAAPPWILRGAQQVGRAKRSCFYNAHYLALCNLFFLLFFIGSGEPPSHRFRENLVPSVEPTLGI